MAVETFTGLNYNAPDETPASIDKHASTKQMNTFFWIKKALIDARRTQVFMQLASTIDMPKHMGKAVKVYQYIPLLDDRNVNDQGIDAKGAKIENGNLYGSSKDVGTIVSKLPVLGENGGRVNRVGFTRLAREGSINKFGWFYEFSKDSLDFDSDAQLQSHLSRELMNGASELTEDMLQKDLLNAAGVVIYPGKVAVSDDQVTGEGDAVTEVDYRTLMQLDQILTDNRCPRDTKIITGTQLTDTKTIPAARVAYVGSELVATLKTMKDLFGNPAFVPVEKYAGGTTVLNGEIGSIDHFRFVEVPEMQHWAGAGAKETEANKGYRATDGKYDVYPILVVGSDSFSTIGFQTDGKAVKFQITTKMPGSETADRNDPYGESGFSSMKFWYGTLIKRPERIALIKTVAKD